MCGVCINQSSVTNRECYSALFIFNLESLKIVIIKFQFCKLLFSGNVT